MTSSKTRIPDWVKHLGRHWVGPDAFQLGAGRALTTLALVLLLLGGGVLSGCNRSASDFEGPGGSSPQDLMARNTREEALAVYHDAWRTVYQDFYDSTFNGQDWYRWKNHYDNVIQDKEDAYVAIDSMLASLNDDYTRFLPPREMKEQNISIDSKLYGVGIQIFVKNKKLVVAAPLEGTPAAKAGIKPKDEITLINGKSTAGMTVEDAADLIRGKEGTTVALTIRRDDKQTFTLTLPRAEIKIKSVFTKDLPDKSIGYIRLNSFISETAFKEMKDAIRKYADRKALIIDLRGNYGGLLSNAVDIADLFLDQGDIVSIVDRNQEVQAYDAKPGQAYRKPVVVLIDGGSASASEILSGALKDNRRATLIGTKTFGKGLVQKINTLADESGINITISKYLTPNGTDINKKGILPDVEVPFTEKDFQAEKDPQLDAALSYLHKHPAPPVQTATR
jgi:carboxyl-terminal processing protease